jgi:hypothetical protein
MATEALPKSRRIGPQSHRCYNRRMASKDRNKKERVSEDRNAASETDGKSRRADKDDSDGDEGQLTPVTPKVGEPPGNLRRRAEWFQKRHGRG